MMIGISLCITCDRESIKNSYNQDCRTNNRNFLLRMLYRNSNQLATFYLSIYYVRLRFVNPFLYKYTVSGKKVPLFFLR